VAFIPPGYFEGTAVARHMLGMNLANVLPVPVAVALAASLLRQAWGRRARDGQPLDRQAPGPGPLEVPSS
jgi:hypothetical protein